MRMRLLAVLATGVFSACGGTGPAVMEFVEITPAQPRIGDVVTVRFRLLDTRGIPLAGEKVDFKLSSVNTAVTLSPATANSLRGSGYAETQLVASSRVNSVIVVATAGDKQVFSPPITFAGSVPNGRQLTFQCGPIAGQGSGGRHAIGAYDETRHLIAGSSIDCTAHVGDRNGDGLTEALVSFLTEAGTIGPSEVSTTNLIGDATVLYKTSLPLPVEVDPGTFTWAPDGSLAPKPTQTGEYLVPLWMHPFNWVENPIALYQSGLRNFNLNEPRRPDPIRKLPNGRFNLNNPRDNLVSMIAVTSGEEGFTDKNNNGKFDADEDFDDLTEPFVDSNDDGTHNDNERFIDVNGNGVWDGKNEKWDANTLIWRQERILWTGMPAIEDQLVNIPTVPGHIPSVAQASPPTLILNCPGAPGLNGDECAYAGPPASITAFVSDPWFNSLARNGDGDGCQVNVPEGSPVRVISDQEAGSAFTYPAGQVVAFTVADIRDPETPPADQRHRAQPPLAFKISLLCSYTSAPRDSYTVKVPVGVVTGTIQ